MKCYAPTALGTIFLLSACDQGPRYVTTEPRISEVTGRYTFLRSKFGNDVDSEILSKAKDAYIDLRENGEVVLHKVPIVADSDTKAFAIKEFRSESGTFQIAALGSTVKDDFYGLYLNVGVLPGPMGHPDFKLQGQLLTLSFEYFDGDFTERMVFTRQKQ